MYGNRYNLRIDGETKLLTEWPISKLIEVTSSFDGDFYSTVEINKIRVTE